MCAAWDLGGGTQRIGGLGGEPSVYIHHVAEKGFNEPFELILYIAVYGFKMEKWF
jgi:hypothetical protein